MCVCVFIGNAIYSQFHGKVLNSRNADYSQ